MTTATHMAILASALLTGALAHDARAQDDLSITASTPVVPVTARSNGRVTHELPTLEFELQVESTCSAGRTAGALSLNVADTRTWVGADQIAANGPTLLTLRIPAAQIPPLTVEAFCEATDAPQAEPGQEQRVVTAALSMQASLLCVKDQERVMTYASRPLGVALVCERQPPEESAAVE